MIEFIKTHFLKITTVIIVMLLIGVAIYNHVDDAKQASYRVEIEVIDKDSTQLLEFDAHGFPRLTRYRSGYELTDYSFVLFETKDSCRILKITKL